MKYVTIFQYLTWFWRGQDVANPRPIGSLPAALLQPGCGQAVAKTRPGCGQDGAKVLPNVAIRSLGRLGGLTKRAALAGVGAMIGASALAQIPGQTTAAPRVALKTALGDIIMELAADKAPITCANFLRYVAAGRYNGAVFYRAMKLVPDPLIGLVQGGVENDPARSFPPIAHESTRVTGLSHKDGTISMARFAPGTATSEIFICVGDIVSLDADPAQPGDNAGFAAFGRVVEGMDVVRAILTAPVSATAGEGVMKGQMLDPKVTIAGAKRITT